jgi:hypothetical protein
VTASRFIFTGWTGLFCADALACRQNQRFVFTSLVVATQLCSIAEICHWDMSTVICADAMARRRNSAMAPP